VATGQPIPEFWNSGKPELELVNDSLAALQPLSPRRRVEQALRRHSRFGNPGRLHFELVSRLSDSSFSW
jgi:hypothetical protein